MLPVERYLVQVWLDAAGNPLQASVTRYAQDHTWLGAIVVPADPFETQTELVERTAGEFARVYGRQLSLFSIQLEP